MSDVNQEAMRAWVGALRSDAYRQGKGKLARKRKGEEDFGFCCLGVACDVYQLLHGDLEVTESELIDGSGVAISFDGAVDYLPEKVQEWLGIESHNPIVLVRTDACGFPERHSAADINDGSGPSDIGRDFNTIADLIGKRFLTTETADAA